MISQKMFVDCMTELFNYYKKPDTLDGPLIKAAWFEKLNEFLDDKQLITACKRCVQKYAFRPSADEFVQLITGEDEIPAIEDWLKILDYARKFGAK